MHLSMLSLGWGGGGSGYPRGFDCEVPRVGILIVQDIPQGGEFNMTTILENEEGLEMNL